MNEIDWSKAPADATHYIAESDSMFECWLKPGYAVRVSRGTSDWVRSDYADGLIADCATARRSSPSWSGEGLPQVGVVCEYRVCDGPWYKCEIRYTIKHPDGGVIAYCPHLDHEQALYAPYCQFRPIRTPEQSAADEREAAIDAMLAATPAPGSDISLRVCEQLYDAGYRKP